MNIKLKKLNDKAIAPTKAHESDFCYDVVAVSEEEVAPNVWRYGLGIALQIDEGIAHYGQVKLAFQLFPRSSVYKTGMVLSNSTGIIDYGYTGEISAVFYHVLPDMPRYKVGDRVAQLCVQGTSPLEFEVVEELDDTDRGANGYGSTGK